MNQYSEKYVDQLEVQIAEQQMQIDQQAERIAELEKFFKPGESAMEQKIKKLEHLLALNERFLEDERNYSRSLWEKLNTPQTKPLTDEEIELIAHRVFEVRDTKEALFDFARAIEERHGIK